jgi:hypothetical protein
MTMMLMKESNLWSVPLLIPQASMTLSNLFNDLLIPPDFDFFDVLNLRIWWKFLLQWPFSLKKFRTPKSMRLFDFFYVIYFIAGKFRFRLPSCSP